MYLHSRYLASALALSLLPGVALAKLPCEKDDKLCQEILDADPDPADGGGALLSNKGVVTLALGDDKKTGSATFNFSSLGHKVSLKLSAPVDSNTGNAEFVGFEGLNGASSLELEYNYIKWAQISFEKLRNAGITGLSLNVSQTAMCGLHLEALAKAAERADRPAGSAALEQALQDLHSLRRGAFEELKELRCEQVSGREWRPSSEADRPVDCRPNSIGFEPLPETTTILEYFALGPEVNKPDEGDEEISVAKQARYMIARILEDLSGGQEGLCSEEVLTAIGKYFSGASDGELLSIGGWLATSLDELQKQPVLTSAVAELRQGSLARAEFLESKWNPFVGGVATIGYKKFEFLDREFLSSTSEVKKTDDRETPWSIGVQGGWIQVADEPSKGDGALIVSASNERSYKEAGKVQACTPVEGFESVSSLQSCQSLPLGGPAEIDSLKVGIEWRQKQKKYAWALRSFYRDKDGESDNFGAELPIYFARDKDKEFTGGISFAWSDDDGKSVAIFVGKQFKVNPN